MTLVQRLHRIERAWAMLDNGQDPRAAATLGRESWQVLARAAALLPPDAGGALLAEAMTIPGAPAPLQIAQARHMRTTGDMEGARNAYAGALLRARPDAALVLEAAAAMPDEAATLVDLCATLPLADPAAAARALDQLDPALAVRAGAALLARGHRDGRLMAALDQLPLVLPQTERDAVALLALNHHMSKAADAASLIAAARAREAGSGWVSPERLHGVLADAVAKRLPFSFVRMGDGEARFLMWRHPGLAPGVDDADRLRAADHIWRNWFGTPLAEMPTALLDEMADALDRSVGEADLLGIASAPRLAEDAHHGGLCLALARYVDGLAPTGRQMTEGLFTYPMERADPYLQRLLGGLDWIGMVSPHPGLAARLAARLGITTHAEWLVPGESRLPGARTAPHLPDVYRATIASLGDVPTGRVVLVAAGLLGKLYAARIRAAGGIALDIGALADAWAGINTRGAGLADSAARPI